LFENLRDKYEFFRNFHVKNGVFSIFDFYKQKKTRRSESVNVTESFDYAQDDTLFVTLEGRRHPLSL